VILKLILIYYDVNSYLNSVYKIEKHYPGNYVIPNTLLDVVQNLENIFKRQRSAFCIMDNNPSTVFVDREE
jgi:hypothetical protein